MKILVLGSSGWVAHYLIPELQIMKANVIGVSNVNKPVHDIENFHFNIDDLSFVDEIKNIECNILINMHHSKNFERAKVLNEELSAYSRNKGIHYVFMSSSNALDGDTSKAHRESEGANGGSDYGKYKAECEQFLYDNNPQASIIRFPATHGYAPNRIARTEEFLQKLKNGDNIEVARGIYQNRPFVGHLAKMMSQVIFDKHSGVFHLGTKDQSEEYEFLQRVATAFGYNEEQLSDGDEYDFNMTVHPKRIYELYGNMYNYTEQDTIDQLVKCPNLSKYKKVL